MKSITIYGSKRESVGKKATKALRNAEAVPCVLYGGDEPLNFSAPEKEFRNLVYTPDVHTVVIDLGNGESYSAIMQDIQFHPVTEAILHMDFYEILEGRSITMEIPIHSEGIPAGVKNGGVLRFNLRRLRVKGLAKNLPDYIVADVTKLKIGDKLYVTEVESEGFKVLHTDSAVICQVKTSRNLELLEPDEDEEEVEAGDVPSTEVGEGEEGAEGDAKEGEGKDKEGDS